MSNFCAWRDQIVAERELQQVVEQQESAHPERKTALDARIAKWKRARDASCEKSSRKEWDGGSMRPAAQAICVTAATKKMTKRRSAMGGAGLLERPVLAAVPREERGPLTQH